MRATLPVVEPGKPRFAIPPQPDVELGAGDPEEPAGLTDVLGDLLVMVNHA